MNGGLAPEPPRLMAQAAVERALPAHMLFLTAEQLVGKGWKLRQDVFMHLNRAAAAALVGLGPNQLQEALVRTDQAATALLRELSMDDPRDELLTCAYFTLKLVAEDLFPDVTNQAVLVSNILIEDAQGSESDWPNHEKQVAEKAGSMLLRANLLGLYRKPLASQTVH